VEDFHDSLAYVFLNEAPNETVEKRTLGSTFPGQPLAERPDSRSEGGLTDVSLRHRSVERAKRVDLADVVYQSKQVPLYIHFQVGPLHTLPHPTPADCSWAV
jgi:hypothetical protein